MFGIIFKVATSAAMSAHKNSTTGQLLLLHTNICEYGRSGHMKSRELLVTTTTAEDSELSTCHVNSMPSCLRLVGISVRLASSRCLPSRAYRGVSKLETGNKRINLN